MKKAIDKNRLICYNIAIFNKIPVERSQNGEMASGEAISDKLVVKGTLENPVRVPKVQGASRISQAKGQR